MRDEDSKRLLAGVRSYPEILLDGIQLQHELVCADPLHAPSSFARGVLDILRVDGCTVELMTDEGWLKVKGAAGIATSLLGKSVSLHELGSTLDQFCSQKQDEVPDNFRERCHAIGAATVSVTPLQFCGHVSGLLTVFNRNSTRDSSLPERMRLLVHIAGAVLVNVSEMVEQLRQRKRAQDALRESERLAMIGRESAAIAHELRNPLEAMGNLLYLLEHASSLDETARTYVHEAEKYLAQLKDVSHHTLGFSRESANPVPVKISDVLEDVLHFYSRKISYKNVGIEKRFEFADEITSYPGELRQLFSNLIVNALEAVDRSHARLRIRTRGSRLWSSGSPGVRVTIADNGTGISPANRAKIFQPFFTTKGGKGNGLGLWVCREIVRRQGGIIQLRSCNKPGRSGTLFSVFLPQIIPQARLAA